MLWPLAGAAVRVASFFTMSYPRRTGCGPQSQLFVYECGGPYGCATSQRSTPVVHTDAATCFIARFARKSASSWAREKKAPSVHKHTRITGQNSSIALYSPYDAARFFRLQFLPFRDLQQCCSRKRNQFQLTNGKKEHCQLSWLLRATAGRRSPSTASAY